MAERRKCDVCPAKYRHYHAPGDPRPLPSVTEVLGVIAKPALQGWAFKMAREAALAAARAAYELTHPGGFSLGIDTASFVAMVDKAAPKSQWALPKTEADIGTLVHESIEADIRRELGQDVAPVEIPEFEVVAGKRVPHPAWNAKQSYLAWRKAHDIKVVSIEQRLWSLKYGFAGTTDVVFYADDLLTVGDFKTSKGIYPEYLLQVAAYREAVLEMEPELKAPVGGVILRFPKEAGDDFEAREVPWKSQKSLMSVFQAAMKLWTWQQEQAS